MSKIIVDVQVIRKGKNGSTILKFYKDGSCDKLTCSNDLVEILTKKARRNHMFA